jgi:hypothetical protein
MIDGIDSSKDPAGKQYRAVVTRPINPGNNGFAGQVSVATVTLARKGSGWVAQLTSLIVNGQSVAVTTRSASVAGAVQNAVGGAVNAVGSLFGRRATPAALTPTASGARVVLPPGTNVSFVLDAPPPSTGAAPAAGAAGVRQPMAGAPQATPAPGRPLGANVKETLLGRNQPAGMFVVSPDGWHMAISAMHGSREIVVLDGVDGPEFDHAARLHIEAIDVAFSPDGRRSAYIAQHGNSVVAVVDGKEAYTIATVPTGVGTDGIVQVTDQAYIHASGDKLLPHQFLISPSGSHIAIVSLDGNNWYMFLDGVKSPPYAQIDLRQVAFAADNLLYAAMTADHKWHMVVNNKPGPAYDSLGLAGPFDTSLQLSDDGRHYAFIARNGGTSVVVADGVPGTPRRNLGNGLHNLAIASNGRVAYTGYSGTGPNGTTGPYKEPLFVGDRQVAPETSTFASPTAANGTSKSVKFVLSPDGNRFAYAKPVPGGVAAVIDGKESIAYDSIGVMQFGPDSRRAFFVGLKNVVDNFVVIDGREMPAQNTVRNFVFSRDGSRFGYEAYGSTGFTIVIDGQPSARFSNVIDNSLAFSADGKHSVYGACTQYLHCQVVEDGVVTNVSGLYTFQTRMPPRIVFPPVLFSPDSTRLVYAYTKSDGTNQNAIVINGQEIMHGTSFTYRCLSPDSQHFATASWNGKGYSIFVDGKVGPTYEDLVETNANPNLFRFEDAHTLRFLGIRDGQVYRVTVDLGG